MGGKGRRGKGVASRVKDACETLGSIGAIEIDINGRGSRSRMIASGGQGTETCNLVPLYATVVGQDPGDRGLARSFSIGTRRILQFSMSPDIHSELDTATIPDILHV